MLQVLYYRYSTTGTLLQLLYYRCSTTGAVLQVLYSFFLVILFQQNLRSLLRGNKHDPLETLIHSAERSQFTFPNFLEIRHKLEPVEILAWHPRQWVMEPPRCKCCDMWQISVATAAELLKGFKKATYCTVVGVELITFSSWCVQRSKFKETFAVRGIQIVVCCRKPSCSNKN